MFQQRRDHANGNTGHIAGDCQHAIDTRLPRMCQSAGNTAKRPQVRRWQVRQSVVATNNDNLVDVIGKLRSGVIDQVFAFQQRQRLVRSETA